MNLSKFTFVMIYYTLTIAPFCDAQNDIHIVNKVDSINDITLDSWGEFPLSIAECCSLVQLNIDTMNPNRIYHLQTIINDTMVKNHRILVMDDLSNINMHQTTCVISKNRDVYILSTDYLRKFNEIILNESIDVQGYDIALQIARLFIRMIFPMISKEIQFFVDEIANRDTYDEFKSYLKRNEVLNSKSNIWFFYTVQKRQFDKHFKKKKWFTQISEKNNVYLIQISTLCDIIARRGHELSPYGRTEWKDWRIVVHRNGTIESKLPHGVRIHGLKNI